MEKAGNPAVSTQLERFQTSVLAPLPFVEPAGNEDKRRPKLVGHRGASCPQRRDGGSLEQRLTGLPLLLACDVRVAGEIEIQAETVNPVLLHQTQQGFLDRHVEDVLQFRSEIAGRGLSDEASAVATGVT